MEIRTIVIIGIMALVTAPVQAELYKWIDETGATTYSATPPPAGAQVLTAPTILAPPTDATPAAQSPEQIGEASKRMTEEAEKRKTEKAEQQAVSFEEQKLEETCKKLRANLEVLNQQGRVIYYDESGEKVRLDPVEQEKKARETEKKIKELCE